MINEIEIKYNKLISELIELSKQNTQFSRFQLTDIIKKYQHLEKVTTNNTKNWLADLKTNDYNFICKSHGLENCDCGKLDVDPEQIKVYTEDFVINNQISLLNNSIKEYKVINTTRYTFIIIPIDDDGLTYSNTREKNHIDFKSNGLIWKTIIIDDYESLTIIDKLSELSISDFENNEDLNDFVDFSENNKKYKDYEFSKENGDACFDIINARFSFLSLLRYHKLSTHDDDDYLIVIVD